MATFDLPYHVPVLADACLEGLNIRPDGTYVDVTFGGGGHSRMILDRLDENGRLFAFDQDPDAQANALNDARFTLIPANFGHLKRFLRLYGVQKIDGLLGDLGVSSHQFDVPERGFTFRAAQSPLDMRMNPNDERTAADLVNTYELRDLTKLFREFAELSNAFQVANALVYQREIKPFETAGDLVNALEKLAPRDKFNQFFARVFQALRMEVNQELEVLENLLLQSTDVLYQNGRLVIISYHSLEDRLVKNYFRAGNFEGKVEKDFYGNDLRPLRPLHAKAVVPTEVELVENPRSRSAKLRIAEKL